jgi:hypothetical protein
MPKKIYSSNAERQKIYRQRKEEKEEASKPILPDTNPQETLVELFRRLEKLEPIPEQIDILKDMENPTIKNLAISCGRGFSKSTLASDMALWYANNYSRQIGKPIDVLLLSSQGVIYTHLDKFFREDSLLRSKLRVSGKSNAIPQKSLTLTDSWSTIFRVVPTENNIRSLRASVLVVDEEAIR